MYNEPSNKTNMEVQRLLCMIGRKEKKGSLISIDWCVRYLAAGKRTRRKQQECGQLHQNKGYKSITGVPIVGKY